MLVLGLLAVGTPSAARASLEYPVKAAFLTKFGSFVTWPESAFATPDSAFVLCIRGTDPFGPLLDQIAAVEQVQGRPIAVRRLAPSDPGEGCHILYQWAAGQTEVRPILDGIGRPPILTVTDAAGRGDQRGIIHFDISGNRVRFHIDAAAADAGGLAISSKLLSLALTVTPRT